MREMELPTKLIRLTMCTMKKTAGRVNVDGNSEEPFPASSGVSQEDSLAPLLFIIVLNAIIKKVGLTHHRQIFNKRYGICRRRGYCRKVLIKY